MELQTQLGFKTSVMKTLLSSMIIPKPYAKNRLFKHFVRIQSVYLICNKFILHVQ